MFLDGITNVPHPEREPSEQSPFAMPPLGGGSSGDARGLSISGALELA